ncbi:MAG: hypothetical protein KUG78_01105 [Kangiellaceae bacterium]|nr:hypothetical protein [Kangiellaceae bacterium]
MTNFDRLIPVFLKISATKLIRSSLSLSLFIILFGVFPSSADDKIPNISGTINYQHAARYSHLQWQELPVSPVAIKIKPLVNFSGIPEDSVIKDTKYYDHGKLPLSINNLFSDLTRSTRYLVHNQRSNDIQLELTINRYSHPYLYAPDEHWYQKLHDQVDRWAVTKKHASVELTLKMKSLKHQFKPWVKSVKATLSHCDINDNPQPLSNQNYKDESLLAYSQSAVGQSFIAASNFLLLQAIEHVNGLKQRAQVESKHQNELMLISEQGELIEGRSYQLYFNDSYPTQYRRPAGKIQIIKSFGHQAIAYPETLRADHIEPGDWVELETLASPIRPKYIFDAKNKCAKVSVAKL